MKRLFLITIVLAVWVAETKGNDPYVGTEFSGGARFLSLQHLNNALANEDLAQLNDCAYSFYLGETFGRQKWLFNSGISVLWAKKTENRNISQLSSWGPSLGLGYKIWARNSMCLYPYFDAAYMFTQISTQQKTDAVSFGSVYEQSVADRRFNNTGEFNAALGLAYQFKISTDFLLNFRGEYNFGLWQSKWKYAQNTIEFPGVDCRGWGIGLSLNFSNR